jgi:hypothetical protein
MASRSGNSDLTREQLDAIRRSPAIKEELTSSSYLEERLLRKSIEKLSKQEFDELHDAAFDAFKSLAPSVHEFSAAGSCGRYPVSVRGIDGAYFYQAPEFDDSRFFCTLDEAIAAVWSDHGGCDLRDEGPIPPADVTSAMSARPRGTRRAR